MSTVGCVCPVWKETRFLPLVLEQMEICPGPKLLLWQDKPLYWLGNGPAPSGFESVVGEMAAKFPSIEVMKMDHAPKDGEDAPYGGFASLAEMAFDVLKGLGVRTAVWLDSDYIYRLADMKYLYNRIVQEPEPRYWSAKARHFWRDFAHIYASTPITVGFPIEQSGLWRNYTEEEITRLDIMCYHPSYVLTDAECYDKISSWGHAPLFKERQFYEKEWIGRDDSQVKPKPTDVGIPDDILKRFERYGTLSGLPWEKP